MWDSTSGTLIAGIRRHGMTVRQQQLTKLYSRYDGTCYDDRMYDWNGNVRAFSGNQAIYVPQFVDANDPNDTRGGAGGRKQKPPALDQRRPLVQYRLHKVIVNRLSQALFADRNAPKLGVRKSDRISERAAQKIAEAMTLLRVFGHMQNVRRYGGAMGTAVSMFDFVDGEVRLTALDPRWCTPTFSDLSQFTLEKLEIRYQVAIDTTVREGASIGVTQTQLHWFRQDIDRERSIVYQLTPVKQDGSEPTWAIDTACSRYHGFGFVPAVWSHNLPNGLAVDGLPDINAAAENQAVDYLFSQAARGSIANCDPTLVIKDNDELRDISTGSSYAVKLSAEGEATLLELKGSGVASAMQAADRIRAIVLEEAQCVLSDAPTGDRATAAEVSAVWESMRHRVGELREQYAQRHVIPLVLKILHAATKLHNKPVVALNGEPVLDDVGNPVVGSVAFLDEMGTSAASMLPKLRAADLRLAWPAFKEPNADDTAKSVASAKMAVIEGFITKQHAVRFLAPVLGIDDPDTMADAAEKERQEQLAEMQQAAADEAGAVAAATAMAEGTDNPEADADTDNKDRG